MRVGRKQHLVYRRYRYRFQKSSVLAISLKNHKDVIAKSVGHVTGLNNDSFNAMKVFKTTGTRSQRNGKENVKITYCRWVAGRRLI